MAGTYTLKHRTMLTAKGKAVKAGHPDGIRLLGPPGLTISRADAIRYGLVTKPKTTAKSRKSTGA